MTANTAFNLTKKFEEPKNLRGVYRHIREMARAGFENCVFFFDHGFNQMTIENIMATLIKNGFCVMPSDNRKFFDVEW